MKLHVLLVLAVGFLMAADPLDDANKDLKKLEGTYVLVSGDEKGEKLPETTITNARLTMEGDKHTVKVGDDTLIGTHKLDSAKKPKTIDVMDTEGPFKDQSMLGIYKIDGDKLTVCFASPGKERPKEFSTTSGTGQFIHVWKKQKKE